MCLEEQVPPLGTTRLGRDDGESVNAKLKLSALDADDLAVISAAVQDALVADADCAYLKDESRFVLLLNRFPWEADRTVEAAHFCTHSAPVFNKFRAVR